MHRLTAVAVAFLAHVVFAQAPSHLQLGVGLQKVIAVPGLQRVAVGDEKIMDVKPLGKDELLLIGVSPGKTTLITWGAKGQRTSYDVEVRGRGASANPPGSDWPAAVALRVSELRLLDTPGVARAAVDLPKVLDAIVIDADHVLVTGLAAGEAKLTMVTRSGESHVVVVSVSAGPQSVDAGEAVIAVKRGGSTVIAEPNLQRVAIGDADIADVIAGDKGLTIKGVAPGVTTLLLWHVDGSRTAWQVVVQP